MSTRPMDELDGELMEAHYNSMELIGELETLCAKYPNNKSLKEQLIKAEDVHSLIRFIRMGTLD